MKILVHMECISENTYFMQFYVIIPDLPSLNSRPYMLIEIIGDIPVESNNHKFLARFYSDRRGIIDTMRLISLF